MDTGYCSAESLLCIAVYWKQHVSFESNHMKTMLGPHFINFTTNGNFAINSNNYGYSGWNPGF